MRSFDIRAPQNGVRVPHNVPAEARPPRPASQPRPKRRGRGPWTLVIVGLVLILGATIAGLYIFGRSSGDSSGVSMAVASPDRITSGDMIEYRIIVDNRDSDLVLADLTLEYPIGFLPSTTQPAADNQGQSLFHLGPVLAGETREVTVRGILIGTVGTKVDVRAHLDYQPSNFHSNFSVDATSQTMIAASRVALLVTAPADAVAGETWQMRIAIQNTTDIPLQGLEAVVEWPSSITDTTATPPYIAANGEHRWDLPALEAGSQWEATATAPIVVGGGSKLSVAVAVYQRVNQQRLLLDRSLNEFLVMDVPQVELNLLVSSSTSTVAASWGARVPVAITYRGIGETPVLNGTLRLRLEGAAIDWEAVTSTSGRRDGEAWVWDYQMPGIGAYLARIEKGSEGAVSFEMPIVSQPVDGSTIHLVATLRSETTGEELLATAGPVTVTVENSQ